MTPKQQRFVDEYMIDCNGTQAAIRAGYSPKTADQQASRLLTKVKVAAAIAEAKQKQTERTEIDADYVLYGIQGIIERCEQAAPVLDRKGEPVLVGTPDGGLAPAYTFQADAALKGYGLLGKHLKLFVDRTEHTGADGGPIKSEVALSDMEFARGLGWLMSKAAQKTPESDG